jgi:putative (di)nucleoside polyphosphate hydrolase
MLGMSENDFLLAEYEAFTQSFWRNEEVGEKRVDFFITLATAVLAAVVALLTSENIDLAPINERRIATAAVLAMLLFGVLFFIRILHRNRVTDEYKEIIKYLRKQIASNHEDLEAYKIPFVRHKRLLRGGLAETIALMNSILGAVVIALWLGSGWGWLLVAFSLPVLFVVQVRIAKLDRDKPQHKKAAAPETFRIGVGAVITNDEGMVLAFERKKIPGAWQLPQGGIDSGESYYDAVIREVEEETGIKEKDLELLRGEPRFVAYEIPEDKRRHKTGRGQVQRWFLFRFIGSEKAITLGTDKGFRDWKWMRMDELAAGVVDFKEAMYQQLEEYFMEELAS